MAELLKLNLGCGNKPRDGYINVDRFGKPDLVVDLEKFPWPWKNDSVGEVLLIHVLEHLGETTAAYLGIIKELYRVCAHDARISVTVPHPRHDDFLNDPTHVRVITPTGIEMFSKRVNRMWMEQGYANTPLALYHDVDFELEKKDLILEEPWRSKYATKQIDADELTYAFQHHNNVVKEIRMVLRVVKRGG